MLFVGCWAPFLRPSSACHHSSCIGTPAGQTTVAGQLHTTTQQSTGIHTTAITYDQPSSNQTICNVQSSSALTNSQTNISNLQQQQHPNNVQSRETNSDAMHGNRQPNTQNSSQNHMRNNTLILSNLSSNEIGESNIVDQKASIHSDVNGTWPAVEQQQSRTIEDEASQPFKTATVLYKPTTILINKDLSELQNDSKPQLNGNSLAHDNPVNTCLTESNGQRNCINV